MERDELDDELRKLSDEDIRLIFFYLFGRYGYDDKFLKVVEEEMKYVSMR